MSTTDERTTRQYPSYATPHTIGYRVGGKFIQEVVFEVFFPELSKFFAVSVHWTEAFTFWRTAAHVQRVSAVRWASDVGGQPEGYSFAAGRYQPDGSRYIVVGASEVTGLVEVSK